MRVNDLFCGSGGMGLGFKKAGFELVYACDLDKYAIESYKANVSDNVELKDIADIGYESLPKADVWTFGFPCQDISVAGKGKGIIKGETRSGLFYEVMRLLKDTADNKPENMPLFILAENVSALSKYIDMLEKEYNQIGYNMSYVIYNSKYHGVAQDRKRYFVLGTRKDIDKGITLSEEDKSNISKISDFLDENVDEKYFLSQENSTTIINEALKRVDITGVHACITPLRIVKRQNGRRAKSDEEPMYTLTTQDKHGVIIKTDDGIKVRVLTPSEFVRLQGFDEDYKQVVSDAKIYKQMGNAVTVNVSEFVANQLKCFINDIKDTSLITKKHE